MKILFMGTPDFAADCLKELVEENRDVAAVITQPDKAMGRGMKTGYSAVKKYALECEKPVFQPETLKDGAISGLLDEINPDVIVVVAYGKILPQYVLDYPKYGCINVHASLLPKYRGAAPVQRAVMDGETETGVTTMLMDKGLDTGDMLLCAKTDIGIDDDAGKVFSELSEIGAKLLCETLDGLENGTVKPQKQDESLATYASKISNQECAVDFNMPAKNVHDKIRGLNPFPGAFCYHNGKVLKLCFCTLFDEKVDFDISKAVPGEVVEASKRGIFVKCSDGLVCLERMKPEGKGVLSSADMVNGRKISAGDILTPQKL